MRWILTDVARKKGRVRHGGKLRRETGEAVSLDVAWETPPDCLLDVDKAVTKLEQADPVAASRGICWGAIPTFATRGLFC